MIFINPLGSLRRADLTNARHMERMGSDNEKGGVSYGAIHVTAFCCETNEWEEQHRGKDRNGDLDGVLLKLLQHLMIGQTSLCGHSDGRREVGRRLLIEQLLIVLLLLLLHNNARPGVKIR